MKKNTLFLILLIFTIFCFIVLFKGLSKDNSYKPNINFGKKLSSFEGKNFFNDQLINSNELFSENKIYVLNIWASWCAPCRAEHSILMELKKNKLIEIIGINYKDNLKNAKKFLEEMGNPYKIILLDKDGTKSIEWGAFGVPETFFIYKNKILKKFVGPLNKDSVEIIEKYLK